jgi:asparagine synthase (glutamine-hydrolysing)
MCGIAGIIAPHSAEQVILKMLKSLEHRGRDDEGYWISDPMKDNHVCLGHRRLSIIDTSSAGHQPMISSDNRYVLTFNGEIYNYRELKKTLQNKGYQFKTDSDTEVLLCSFAEWDIECLNYLNGMFAFAIWDDKDRKLIVARDRLGIKPVYYAQISSKEGYGPAFIFASEVKALLSSELIDPELDFEGLNQFLTFLWTPDPYTLFKGIKTLPPGHLLVWQQNGDISIREWWDIKFDQVEEGKSDDYWQAQILETLDRVIQMEMVADVPLGSFLSGGLDSSTIVALMNQHRNGRRISTYTIGIEADDLRYDIIPDDVKWARIVGEKLDTDYHEIMLKPDVSDLLPKLIYHMDEPGSDMMISSYLVSRAARETLTVLLSGMGGDELFAGYPRQMAMNIAGILDPIPQPIRRPFMKLIEASMPGGMPGMLTAPLRNVKKFARSAALNFEDRYLGFGTYFTNEAKQNLYSDNLREATRDMDAYSQHREYFHRVKNAAPLNQLLYVDLKTFLPCLNLIITDKTSMANTLEVRVPFLNHELVELSARIPPHLKLNGLKRKYVLKRAAEKLLPHDVVWRKKAGFSAPIRSWLRGPLLPMMYDLLSETNIKRRGLFNPKEVKRIISTNLSGYEDYNLQVFQLLTLELWHQTFIKK